MNPREQQQQNKTKNQKAKDFGQRRITISQQYWEGWPTAEGVVGVGAEIHENQGDIQPEKNASHPRELLVLSSGEQW